jgi:hypothetical protein
MPEPLGPSGTPVDTSAPHETHVIGHETRDININVVLIFACVTLVVVIVACIFLAGMFSHLAHVADKENKSPYPLAEREREKFREMVNSRPNETALGGGLDRTGPFPPEPRLEGIDPDPMQPRSGVFAWPSAAQELDKREAALLSETTWFDSKAGKVRIPIERAMERLAGKLPVSKSGPPSPDVEQSYKTPSHSNSGRGPSGGSK